MSMILIRRFFFFSSRRRHTRYWRDWFRRVLFRSLAIALGACLNAGLLYHKLRQHGIYQPRPGWGVFALKVAAALAVMGLLLWLAMAPAPWWLAARSEERRVGKVGRSRCGRSQSKS